LFKNRATSTGENNQSDPQAELALMIYSRLSEFTLQESSYKKFYDSIQFRIAELFQNENQTASAKKTYMEILKKDPLSADAAYNLGLIHEKEGNWKKALSIWRKLNADIDTSSFYWFESKYRTARALKHLGKPDEANVIITMTQVLHPDLGNEELKEKFIQLKNELKNEK